MFNGVPAEQLHQFMTSSTRPSSLPLPLSFSSSSLHHHHASSNANTFPTFDPYTSNPPSQQVLQLPHHHLFPPLHHQQYSPTQKNQQDKQDNNNSNSSSSSVVAMNFEIERDRSISEPVEIDPPWSNEEVLALLRIRSSFENWFPEITWEHVSRKLEEIGYKRSAQKCKAKFEEESRWFNNINYNKSYRLISEFEEVYDQGHQNTQVVAHVKNKKMENSREGEEGEEDDETEGDNLDEDSKKQETNVGDPCEDNEKLVDKAKGNKKRKRQKNFELFKGFCEDIVKKMMAQQEEMMNKLLEDMIKRDEQKVAREEAWKKQEMDRINKELEIRAYEHGITGDRQTTIIKLLKGFTASSETQCFDKLLNTLNSPTSSPLNLQQNPNSPTVQVNKQNNLEMASVPEPSAPQNPSLNLPPTQNPNSPKTQNKQLPSTSSFSEHKAPHINHGSTNDKEDLGKRWPRDEVFALINLRRSLYNNGEDKEGAAFAAKTPLWERISQGMLELGYKRSAKKCKEKWENINKYFRKTKDNNKKRSLDSRTCPYFHQLSTLYNQGTLAAPSTALPENHHVSSQGGSSSTNSTVEDFCE
ncbi:trihelix transcription factor GTL2-like isoform X2 [Mangifera indica]|uniref:trihelix transcription factor GTL2-like isoform X2 n=1 Tax=Mangifera indica TaxID=29780 RepID=UPI001CFB19DB|nr:trihelix transcription factor GTL2-like isoform X2 [Mangifera indica]